MPFTTVNDIRTHVPQFEDESSLLVGISVLRDMVGHIKLPQDRRHELLALSALESLLANRNYSETVVMCRDELFKEVQLLKREDILRLVQWICPTRWTFHRLWPWCKRRSQRHLHLLILLARVIAPVSRYVVIPVLAEMGLCPDRTECHRTLNWVQRYCGRDYLKLARRYLELTCKVWFEETPQTAGRRAWNRIGEISTWPWQQQILELLAWRMAWNVEQNNMSAVHRTNPVFVSETIEFCLAREQMFGRMRRAGGRLAATVIEELRYRDLPCNRSHRQFLLVMLAGLLTGLGGLLLVDAAKKAEAWNSSNLVLTEQIFTRVEAAVSWLPRPDAHGNDSLENFFASRYEDFRLNKSDSLRGQ